MNTNPYQLTLPTPFGETAFGIEVSDTGEVTHVALPLEGLPDSVYKLTYGRDWRERRAYFTALAVTLPYRIGASLNNTRFPTALRELVHYRGSIRSDDYAVFWREHPEWMGLFEFGESKLNRRLKKFIAAAPLPAFAPYLLDYLQSLLPVSSERTEALLWRAIGALATGAAKEILLSALESEGRHPFTLDILVGLEHFTDNATLRRLIQVYRVGKFNPNELEAHLRRLHRFASAPVIEHSREVLGKHPEQVEAIAVTLRAAGQSDREIAGQLYAQFLREADYYVLDALVRSTNDLGITDYRIDLHKLNEKMDAPVYLELPLVNWPQQLETGWRQLIEATPDDELLTVVATYLDRPEPRLQRNAILQLKYYRGLPGRREDLPAPIERRMRELLASPYDKVYVEILNILGDRPVELSERERMFEALLEVSLRSPYRTVVLRAIYRVGKGAEWRAFARTYYLHKLASADSAMLGKQLAAALPYLAKYLGDTEPLHAALNRRPGNAT